MRKRKKSSILWAYDEDIKGNSEILQTVEILIEENALGAVRAREVADQAYVAELRTRSVQD